jgi:hypothetical protein
MNAPVTVKNMVAKGEDGEPHVEGPVHGHLQVDDGHPEDEHQGDGERGVAAGPVPDGVHRPLGHDRGAEEDEQHDVGGDLGDRDAVREEVGRLAGLAQGVELVLAGDEVGPEEAGEGGRAGGDAEAGADQQRVLALGGRSSR